MKISQMTADQAADALIKISQPVANIVDDEEMEPIVKQIAESGNLPVVKIISTLVPKVVPFALKKHKTDLYEIVGALAQEPASKVGKMTVLQLMTVIRESVDQDLIDFFKQSGESMDTAGK